MSGHWCPVTKSDFMTLYNYNLFLVATKTSPHWLVAVSSYYLHYVLFVTGSLRYILNTTHLMLNNNLSVG